MNSIRWSLLVALAVLTGPAQAGPIQWSYNATGASDGWWHGIEPVQEHPMISYLGQTEELFLIGGWRYLSFVNPLRPQGPTMWSAFTVSDVASGQSLSFGLPLEFYDVDPGLDDGYYVYEPRVASFAPVHLVLGNHRYTVGNSAYNDRGLSVRISETPEPTTLVLCGVGLLGLGFTRLRRRNHSTSSLDC